MIIDPENDIHDEDDELANADRGDDFDPDAQPDDPENPLKGKDGAPADGRSGEPADGDSGNGGEEEDDEDEEDEEDDEEDDEGDGEGRDGTHANLPIRYRKVKRQRDEAKERAEALERQLREREEELQRLRGGKKGEPESEPEPEDPIKAIEAELGSLYEQVEEARADGDTKTAARLQRQIDANNRKIAEITADRAAKRTVSAAVEKDRFDEYLERAEKMIPALNAKSDKFDPAAVAEVEELLIGLRHAGNTPSQALQKAIKLAFKVDLANPGAAPADKGGKDEGEDERGGDGKGKGKGGKPDPKKPDVQKAVDTQRRQPPDMSKAGADQDTQSINISKLSDEEFDKLPESVKAKYRGDEF